MEKKHLTVICGVFFPEPSPTGLCAKRLIELLDESYDIDVICISGDGTNKIVKDRFGHTVYMLTGYRQGKEDRANGLGKKLWHQLGRIEIKSVFLGNLNWYAKAIYKCLMSIHEQRRIDTVFSICSPFAAHVGAYTFKIRIPDVRWCAYTVDPYSTAKRIRPLWCTLNRLIRYEQRILKKADHLLLSDEVYNSRSDLIQNKDITDALPYILPEFEYQENGISYFNSKFINCVYAGRFYEDIRNPESMLQAFTRMNNPRIKLHLFSIGCESIIKKYSLRNDIIELHKMVPHKEIGSVYSEADVLIMIANTTDEFLPSKTFEYIATGKPIICFNSSRTDSTVLENYPFIYRATGENDIKNIELFIEDSKGKKADKETVEKAYERHLKESVRIQLLHSMDQEYNIQ